MKFRVRLYNPVRVYEGVESITFKDCDGMCVNSGTLSVQQEGRRIETIATIIDAIPDTAFYRVSAKTLGTKQAMDFQSIAIECQR